MPRIALLLLSVSAACCLVASIAAGQTLTAFTTNQASRPSPYQTAYATVELGFSNPRPPHYESRVQRLIPAHLLPGAGTIRALEVAGDDPGGGRVPYKRLEIRLAMTTLDRLSYHFGSNLVRPAGGALVFWLKDVAQPYPRGLWTRLLFSPGFQYDGVSSLIIEYRKLVDPTKVKSTFQGFAPEFFPFRSDLPRVASATGAGSFQATMATGLQAGTMRVRLVWQGPPTLMVDSTWRNGAHNRSRANFALGETVTVTTMVSGSGAYWGFLDVARRRKPLAIPGIRDHYWLVQLIAPYTGPIPMPIGPSGRHDLKIRMPVNPSLLGLHLHLQHLVQNTARTLEWTNTADFWITD